MENYVELKVVGKGVNVCAGWCGSHSTIGSFGNALLMRDRRDGSFCVLKKIRVINTFVAFLTV